MKVREGRRTRGALNLAESSPPQECRRSETAGASLLVHIDLTFLSLSLSLSLSLTPILRGTCLLLYSSTSSPLRPLARLNMDLIAVCLTGRGTRDVDTNGLKNTRTHARAPTRRLIARSYRSHPLNPNRDYVLSFSSGCRIEKVKKVWETHDKEKLWIAWGMEICTLCYECFIRIFMMIFFFTCLETLSKMCWKQNFSKKISKNKSKMFEKIFVKMSEKLHFSGLNRRNYYFFWKFVASRS